MSDEQMRMIEDAIKRYMVPIYWMVGGTLLTVLTIFVTISVPMLSKLIEVSNIQQTKANQKDVDTKFDNWEKAFINKREYYQVEEDEHKIMLEAFDNPENARYILEQANNNIATYLGLKYQSRGNPK